MRPPQTALAFVLAGGEGRRLQPLTRERSKPAVYFGGPYRLIDFVLSNLVNSGFHQVKVLTQYRSTSLLRHLARAWPVFSTFGDEFIEAVPAAMNLGPNWYRGTADAIWQNLDILRDTRPDHVVIFGSDHVYKMDVGLMYEQHIACSADVTVAALPVPRKDASAFGCLHVDDTGRIIAFIEKPANPPGMPGNPDMTLVSMGNCVFRTPALVEALRDSYRGTREPTYDFSRDVLTNAVDHLDIYAYDFRSQLCPGETEHNRGYWRDVGTIDAYFEASMDLVSVHPRLDLYNPRWPIKSAQPTSGPAKFVFRDLENNRVGHATDSIVGAGSIVSGGEVVHAVCGHDVRVHSYASVEESVLFPFVDVGRGARLRRCVVDRGVHIPAGFEVGFDIEEDRKHFTVSEEGVVVVGRAALGQVDEFDVDIDDAPRFADRRPRPPLRPSESGEHMRPAEPTRHR